MTICIHTCIHMARAPVLCEKSLATRSWLPDPAYQILVPVRQEGWINKYPHNNFRTKLKMCFAVLGAF